MEKRGPSKGDSPDIISPSKEIDAIISLTDDWRGKTLAHLRSVITKADASIIEEVKWKKPSKPEGVPVWSREGIICVADTLKSSVRLTFPKGAQIKDPWNIFNARLDSKTVRAIDYHQGDSINDSGLTEFIREANDLNMLKNRTK